MKHFNFDVTPINDESIATAMQPFNAALEKANAVAAQYPHLHWTYTLQPDPLNPMRYVLKIVGVPKQDDSDT